MSRIFGGSTNLQPQGVWKPRVDVSTQLRTGAVPPLPTSATSPMLPGKVSLSTFVVPVTVSEERCGASSTGGVDAGRVGKTLHPKLGRFEEDFVFPEYTLEN